LYTFTSSSDYISSHANQQNQLAWNLTANFGAGEGKLFSFLGSKANLNWVWNGEEIKGKRNIH
jgi:hypothetical protein